MLVWHSAPPATKAFQAWLINRVLGDSDKDVPVAVAPHGHHAHVHITGGTLRCRQSRLHQRKQSHEEDQGGGVSYIQAQMTYRCRTSRCVEWEKHQRASPSSFNETTEAEYSLYSTCIRANGSTLASRYMLVHILISYIQIDGWRTGRWAITSINLGLLCPASEQVAHMQQLPPPAAISEINRDSKALGRLHLVELEF